MQERALGKGGVGSWAGAGLRRGPETNSRDRRAGTPQPAFAMKRPRAPSGSDGESDGPIDVGQENDLR